MTETPTPQTANYARRQADRSGRWARFEITYEFKVDDETGDVECSLSSQSRGSGSTIKKNDSLRLAQTLETKGRYIIVEVSNSPECRLSPDVKPPNAISVSK